MPGSLTDTEKKQILDHFGWSIASLAQDYPFVYVNPVLDSLTNDAALVIVREHLSRLNAAYTKLTEVIDNFDLAEVKGIKFHDRAEQRAWSQYKDWVFKLGAALNVEPNPKIYSRKRRGRSIR